MREVAIGGLGLRFHRRGLRVRLHGCETPEWTRAARRRPGPRSASCPTTRAWRCTTPGSRRPRLGPAARDRDVLREVGDLPRRRGARGGQRAVHRRPPPRVGGEPGGLGAPRRAPRRPPHRAHGHAAVLPAHDRGRRARGRRGRGDRRSRRRSPRTGRTPLGLVFIDGGHAFDVALADYEGWSPPRRARAACSCSTTCSRTRPTAARRPFQVWQRAVADGFTPVSTTGSLRVLAPLTDPRVADRHADMRRLTRVGSRR